MSTVKVHPLNPDFSGPVTIDQMEWSNATNYMYASLVDCTDPNISEKFRTMDVSELRNSTRDAMEVDVQKMTNAALEIAYAEKFKDADMRAALLKTGTVLLKSPRLTCSTSLRVAPLDEATELMKRRDIISRGILEENARRDEQAYIRRVKQSARIYKAMKKLLYEGNSLDNFKHFSIASIPSELAHTGDASSNITSIAPEIKSAALTLNGNILYNLVRRNELRNYKNDMDKLKGDVAKECVSFYILNTKYPHFYKESVSKHTGNLKSEIHSIRLSLENSNLDIAARRELIDKLECAQNNLKEKTSVLSKTRVYKKHTELLNNIPNLSDKVWQIYKSQKFPQEVQDRIKRKVSHLYSPSDLEVERAEGWTHRCQEFKPASATTESSNEIGEYVISKKELKELSVEYPIQMNIDGKCFTSAAHYVLFRLLAYLLGLRLEQQIADIKAYRLLIAVSGKFVGIQKATDLYLKYRDQTYEILLRNACKKALEAWISSSPKTKEILNNQDGVYQYKSSNIILGIGPVGAEQKGLNLVGLTLHQIQKSK